MVGVDDKFPLKISLLAKELGLYLLRIINIVLRSKTHDPICQTYFVSFTQEAVASILKSWHRACFQVIWKVSVGAKRLHTQEKGVKHEKDNH